MKNNPYTRKIKKPFFIKVFSPPDIWSHIYGLASFIGLIITIIVLFKNYNSTGNEDFNFILTALTSLLASVLLIFLISVIYFNRRIKQLGEIPADYHFYREEFEKQEIIINQISECSHIITHYYRNLDLSLQDIINKEEEEVTEEELLKTINKFEYFLINITTNIQSFFSQITDDNCSITIKLLNLNNEENPYLIRTYFRDPVNFKKRRETDLLCGPCSVYDNTAFSIIIDPAYKNTYFSEDNLPDLYDNHLYNNPNPDWHKFYKSTLVVPISVVTGENERKILGFLSVDNFKGGLAINSNKEYLFFVADLLYLAFNKFDKIINLANIKNIKNDKIDRYTDWN